MKCPDTKRLMSACLGAAVTRSEMSAVQHHIDACVRCSADYLKLQRTQRLVGDLGRKPAPSDLALRIRVSVSQEMANSRRPRGVALRVRWANVFNAVMVPSPGGLVSTVFI